MASTIINWPSKDHCPNLLGEVKAKAEQKLGECDLRFQEGPALESSGGVALANTGQEALKYLDRIT